MCCQLPVYLLSTFPGILSVFFFTLNEISNPIKISNWILLIYGKTINVFVSSDITAVVFLISYLGFFSYSLITVKTASSIFPLQCVCLLIILSCFHISVPRMKIVLISQSWVGIEILPIFHHWGCFFGSLDFCAWSNPFTLPFNDPLATASSLQSLRTALPLWKHNARCVRGKPAAHLSHPHSSALLSSSTPFLGGLKVDSTLEVQRLHIHFSKEWTGLAQEHQIE